MTLQLKRKIFGSNDEFSTVDDSLEANKGIKELSSIKSLIKLGDWKGKDFMSWLLYYGVPFLSEFSKLDEEYLSNFKQLSQLIFILSCRKIRQSDLKMAHHLKENFIATYEIYGDENKIPNFHELSHIISQIKFSGPLQLYSTFNFERLNYEIKKCVRSSLRPDVQIAKRLGAIKAIERDFEHLKSPEYSTSSNGMRCTRPNLEDHIRNFIPDGSIFFSKFNKPNFQIETEIYGYKFMKKKYFIKFEAKFCKIISIFNNDNQTYIIIQQLNSEKITLNTYKISGLGSCSIINIEESFEKVVPIFIKNNIYLSLRPNLILNE